MTYAPLSRFAIGLSALSLLALSLGSLGCAGGSSSGGTGGSAATGTGGSGSGTGGAGTGTGGSASSTGGSVGTGGSGTGGSVSTGGTPGTGGSVSTGGVPGSGGSGTGGATGGSSGTGGSTATGGSTGTGGSASGTGGAAGGGATTFYTDDFESDMAGKQPAGWDNIIDYNYKTTNPQSSGDGAVADGTHTHNGSKLAVHFSAQGGSLMVLLERPLPSGTNHLYVRAYFYLANSIGDEPASSSDNHETLLGLTSDPTSANNQIRFGQIKGALGTNESVSDNIAPVQSAWNMGSVISANTWHCIEVEFNGTAAYNSLYAYSDGALVHSITSAADWAHSPGQPANWMNGYFTNVMFGWQSFSSMKNDVWMDDLAMSTTGRIGCN